MLTQIEGEVQNGTSTKTVVLLYYLKNLFQYKNLLQGVDRCTNYPNFYFYTFCKRWIVTEGSCYL